MNQANKRIALFPGTFDPITNGHLDIIRRGNGLFDELIVAVAHNPDKNELMTINQRLEIITQIFEDENINATVQSYRGLTVDYAKTCGASVILRGLRNVTDLAYEFQLALTNRALADIETVFVMSGEQFGFTSSSLIRQIAAGGGLDRLHQLLPTRIIDFLRDNPQLIKKLSQETDIQAD